MYQGKNRSREYSKGNNVLGKKTGAEIIVKEIMYQGKNRSRGYIKGNNVLGKKQEQRVQ